MTETGWLPATEQVDPVVWFSAATPDHGQPAGEDYVVAVHELVRRLVSLDVESGGDAASIAAVRTFKAAAGRIRGGTRDPRFGRDLDAALAELAELTAWLLCDANRQGQASRMNRIALTLAQRCGDRSMELFVLHNMSLQATYLRRPVEALELVEPVLDRGRLSPRLSSMFHLRVARAQAQMGLPGDAFKSLDHAACEFFEGICVRDPPWSWWVSERGLNSATAAMHGGLGNWKAAIPFLHRALGCTPAGAHRDRNLYLCVLLNAQVEAGAWHDAERTAVELLPLLSKVGSTRPHVRLAATLDRVRTKPTRLKETIRPLLEALRPHPVRREPTGAGLVRVDVPASATG